MDAAGDGHQGDLRHDFFAGRHSIMTVLGHAIGDSLFEHHRSEMYSQQGEVGLVCQLAFKIHNIV